MSQWPHERITFIPTLSRKKRFERSLSLTTTPTTAVHAFTNASPPQWNSSILP
jgi:hypothetical protein